MAGDALQLQATPLLITRATSCFWSISELHRLGLAPKASRPVESFQHAGVEHSNIAIVEDAVHAKVSMNVGIGACIEHVHQSTSHCNGNQTRTL
jgi:hypothetical protein